MSKGTTKSVKILYRIGENIYKVELLRLQHSQYIRTLTTNKKKIHPIKIEQLTYINVGENVQKLELSYLVDEKAKMWKTV